MFSKMKTIISLLAPLALAACIAPIPVSRESIIGKYRAQFWQGGYDAIKPGETTRAQVLENLREPNAEWVEARTLIYYAGPPGGSRLFVCIGAGGGGYCDVTDMTPSRREIIILVRLNEADIVASKDWLKGPRKADRYGQFLREWIAPDAPRQAIPSNAVPVVFQHLRIDQTRQEAEGSFRYKLASFDSGGRFEIISSEAQLLEGDDGANGWMKLELPPGTHYLDFYLNYFKGMFRIDVPKGADIVYAGSISTDRIYRGANPDTKYPNSDLVISVSDAFADNETLLRSAFPQADNIENSIFQLHDGPILLYEPLPNAPATSD